MPDLIIPALVAIIAGAVGLGLLMLMFDPMDEPGEPR